MTNPFQPSFGKNPPQIIGRREIIADFIAGLDQGVGDERRATLYTGPRGMGKTVVLNQIAKEAQEKGWITAEVTASQTMLNDILDQVVEQTKRLVPYSKRDVTGFNFSIFGIGAGVTSSIKSEQEYGWRMKMTKILEELAKKGIGVLFTIDEVYSGSVELKTFVTTYQHFVREDCKVAVAMAGLPFEVSDLLSDKVLTFLRRAHKVPLQNVSIEEAELGMLKTIEDNNRSIEPTTLHEAALATDGYPYLIQLVGAKTWDVRPGNKEISSNDVSTGTSLSKERLFENVVLPVLSDLSQKDREVLQAMSIDNGPSRTGQLAERLGVNQNYFSNYRKRLIDASVVFSPSNGLLDYAIPYMREYFQEK